MELLFLGTGSADWEAFPTKKENIRRRSSVAIDGHILIDASPTSYEMFLECGGDASKITDIFLTHSHGDHLWPDAIKKFVKSSSDKIRFWCDKGVEPFISDIQGLDVRYITPYDEFVIDGYKIIPLKANHNVEDSLENPLHYLFEHNGKRLFYGCDGAWILSKTWERLFDVPLDIAVFECTSGDVMDPLRLGCHNSLPMLDLLIDGMRKVNTITDDTIVIASHIAQSSFPNSIAETRALFKSHNIISAEDGMVVRK